MWPAPRSRSLRGPWRGERAAGARPQQGASCDAAPDATVAATCARAIAVLRDQIEVQHVDGPRGPRADLDLALSLTAWPRADDRALWGGGLRVRGLVGGAARAIVTAELTIGVTRVMWASEYGGLIRAFLPRLAAGGLYGGHVGRTWLGGWATVGAELDLRLFPTDYVVTRRPIAVTPRVDVGLDVQPPGPVFFSISAFKKDAVTTTAPPLPAEKVQFDEGWGAQLAIGLHLLGAR
jgi:hypothetical protein